MRDPNRINRVVELLRAAWLAEPDLRLGQLLSHIAGTGDVFYIEDGVIERRLKQHLFEEEDSCP